MLTPLTPRECVTRALNFYHKVAADLGHDRAVQLTVERFGLRREAFLHFVGLALAPSIAEMVEAFDAGHASVPSAPPEGLR